MSVPPQRAALHDLLRRARKARVVFTVATYTLLSPIGYLFFAALSAIGTRHPTRRARRLQRVTAGAYRLMHDWLRLVRITRFNHRDGLQGLPSGPCVVVANHPTLMDVTAIIGTLRGGCTVVKPELFRRRMLNPLLRDAGHVEGPGSDPVATGRVVDEAVQRLADGLSLVIFPEGTRSPPGRLRPFGRAAFEIACRARVPVVSIAVRCEPLWLSKEVPLFSPPHPVPVLELQTLAVDDPARVDYDSRALRREVEGRFRTWFAAARSAGPILTPNRLAAKDAPCPTSSKTG